MRNPNSKRTLIPVGMLGVLMLAGCATTAPTAKFTEAISPEYAVRTSDTAKAVVDAAPGVSLFDYEKSRLTQEIEAKIAAKQQLNPATGQPKAYEVDVTLTQYEKGNAFARAMLAGLGQIHIAGNVTVYLLPGRTQIGAFTIKKTFAWGGMYGGVTSMETIEQGFAEGIAAAVTGQVESKPAGSQ
jgi:predicted component of type VI protein secretion system